MDKRTIDEFVEDMVSNGRSLSQITVVALCTKWAPYLDEIIEKAAKLLKKK